MATSLASPATLLFGASTVGLQWIHQLSYAAAGNEVDASSDNK